MTLIRTTDQLAKFCRCCSRYPYVAVDTEFMRDTTYFPQLCLVQIAAPDQGKELVAAVDTLSDDLSLDPIYELFANPCVTKVFHSARQDLEIFYLDRKVFPQPFFDTQIAAMACGYAEQVSYEALVRLIVNRPLDKSRQFSAWNRRPLTRRQLDYALGDVIHLRVIYEHLVAELTRLDRGWWLDEEFVGLLRPELYAIDPENAWKRLKTKNVSARYMAAIRQIAQFREEIAQRRNVPRNRVLSDKAMAELSSARPTDLSALEKCRQLPGHLKKGSFAQGLIKAVRRAQALPAGDAPARTPVRRRAVANHGFLDLLRALLKANSVTAGVAPSLIATTAELEMIAAGETCGRVFTGWRNEIFGRDARRLANGEIALKREQDGVRIVATGIENIPSG